MQKRVIPLLLVLVLLGSLGGCGLFGADLEPLYGSWTMTEYLYPEDVEQMLYSLDFYDSEVALADLDHFGVVKVATFDEELYYSLAYDNQASQALVREYFDTLLTTLYANRDLLVDDYGAGIAELDEETFKANYADMFGQASYEALLDLLTENCMDYGILEQNSEVGIYRAGAKGEILCRVDAEAEEERLRFTVEGNTLTLIYADSEECYTRN